MEKKYSKRKHKSKLFGSLNFSAQVKQRKYNNDINL